MLSEDQIINALRDCFDPEVKLNLVDLSRFTRSRPVPILNRLQPGRAEWVKVTMTLTTEYCPASGLIIEQIHNRLATISDISKVDVNLVWEPKWTPHRISEAGRKQLGL